jgi:xylulokinase
VTRAPVTVGIDIGTSSVKAVAADEDGNVVAATRVPHEVRIPTSGRLEHDAEVAWRRGPRDALAVVSRGLDVRGVSVAAMVPSLTAVDADAVPLVPGLLYGDDRGGDAPASPERSPLIERGELLGFLAWATRHAPDAHGYWPAQAVANHALSGEPVIDTATAMTAIPFFDLAGWDKDLADELGVEIGQMPRVLPTGAACGRVDRDGPVLASGCVDVLAEQLVAGADEGDVLVILGTTLIAWIVTAGADRVPGYWMVPHTTPGLALIGGPSEAGGLFLDWMSRAIGGSHDAGDGQVAPGAVPVWAPYPRGERVPLHDRERRAQLVDLDLTHDVAAIRRAAFEASGFVVRRLIDAARTHAALEPRRIVATGGGTRVDGWVQALADATGLPVECTAVAEGGALGSAWLARIAAGLEAATGMTEARRWTRPGRAVEPDPRWSEPVADRYRRFLELSSPSSSRSDDADSERR